MIGIKNPSSPSRTLPRYPSQSVTIAGNPHARVVVKPLAQATHGGVEVAVRRSIRFEDFDLWFGGGRLVERGDELRGHLLGALRPAHQEALGLRIGNDLDGGHAGQHLPKLRLDRPRVDMAKRMRPEVAPLLSGDPKGGAEQSDGEPQTG